MYQSTFKRGFLQCYRFTTSRDSGCQIDLEPNVSGWTASLFIPDANKKPQRILTIPVTREQASSHVEAARVAMTALSKHLAKLASATDMAAQNEVKQPV